MAENPDWVTLTDGEEVLWHSRPAIYPYAWATARALVVSIAGAALLLLSRGVFAGRLPVDIAAVPELYLVVAGGVLVVYGVVRASVQVLQWASVQYLLTTEELYTKRGLFSRTVTNLRIERVQNTTFSQSVLGRVLSYGDVAISTAGGGGVEMVFRDAPDPEHVVERITRQVGTHYD